MEQFFNLILKYLGSSINLITPVRYCDKGYCVIKKIFGKPYKIFNAGLCFKIPLLESFDVVNIKKQVHFLNAHSVKAEKDKVIPYNITVDAQVEFRIIDPYVIYHIDTIDTSNREPLRIYVDNEVHLLINNVISNSDVTNVQNKIDELLKVRNSTKTDDYFKNAVLIERIIISAFDYNLSIRHAQ